VLVSSSPVNRIVLFPSVNHFSISVRSYVCPTTIMTVSFITSIVNGHLKTTEVTDPVAAVSVRDILFVGAGASSGSITDHRTTVERTVSAAPHDPSEGDKLKVFETGHKYCLPVPVPVPISGPPPPSSHRQVPKLGHKQYLRFGSD
jgi:hypothetical protein